MPLTLRARLAWAHDWVSDPSLAALFQALPGASFIVNGATPVNNSALASAGAEFRLQRRLARSANSTANSPAAHDLCRHRHGPIFVVIAEDRDLVSGRGAERSDALQTRDCIELWAVPDCMSARSS